MLGALLAGRVARRPGLGPTILLGTGLAAAGVLIPLAGGPALLVFGQLIAARGLVGLGAVVVNIHRDSLRQSLIPADMQGRVSATMRFIEWGTLPVGAVLGGVLATQIGVRTTLLVAALGSVLSMAWILPSPIRTLRIAPSPKPPP